MFVDDTSLIFFIFFCSLDFKCHLKNNKHHLETKAKEGATSGMPARFCQFTSMNQFKEEMFWCSRFHFHEKLCFEADLMKSITKLLVSANRLAQDGL